MVWCVRACLSSERFSADAPYFVSGSHCNGYTVSWLQKVAMFTTVIAWLLVEGRVRPSIVSYVISYFVS